VNTEFRARDQSWIPKGIGSVSSPARWARSCRRSTPSGKSAFSLPITLGRSTLRLNGASTGLRCRYGHHLPQPRVTRCWGPPLARRRLAQGAAREPAYLAAGTLGRVNELDEPPTKLHKDEKSLNAQRGQRAGDTRASRTPIITKAKLVVSDHSRDVANHRLCW
jgi:hypothetical protein